jgi:hypothetical protein
VTRRLTAVVIAAAAGLAAVSGLFAEQTRFATADASDLNRGDARGVAVTSLGRLFLAPRLAPLGKPLPGGDPAQVFAIASDASGNLYLGTGPDGQVVRVTPAGETSVLFRSDEPLVTALLSLPSGGLLAGTAPGGAIYKIRPDGKAVRWCDTGERYVWAMLPGPDETVLAVTGDRGRLLRIDRSGNASIVFDADEAHLVSLAPAPGGGWFAGGAERGLVYRVDADAHASVVYDDDDLPEVKSIAVTGDGGIVVALDAAPPPERRLPAVRIQVAGGAAQGDARSELDDRSGSALSGVIEGLPSRDEHEEGARLRGKVVRLAADGAVTPLWTSRSEAPFALVLDGAGRPIFATGEPARIWRVESPDETAAIATLKEAQASALLAGPRSISVATSNPEATYRIDKEFPESGTFVSASEDAGSVARWGSLRWRRDGSGGRVEMSTRTGNSGDPDGTWSAWSAPVVDAEGSPVASPAGRYLQWRARFAGVTGDGPRLADVTATYAAKNRVPVIRDFRVEPSSGAVAAKATFRWSVADPDGDPVAVDVQVRPSGGGDWKSAARADAPASKVSDSDSRGDTGFKDGKATWDAASFPEGAYEVRAVASDEAANPTGEGLSSTDDLATRVRVDRTPPDIEARRVAGGALEVTVTDSVSEIVRLELLQGGRVLASPRSVDGVCDGRRETFRLTAEEAGPAGDRTLRAEDRAGNTADLAVPAP